MSKIVIIGAGAMGSAFAVPCADNSNEVYLVGSFLEDKVIEEINLKKKFSSNIKISTSIIY
jgi:glycerol-3-phosphate dehydrogenase (NAD(P)+)